MTVHDDELSPESPGRRRLFLGIAAGAGTLVAGSLCAAAGRLALAPLARAAPGGEGRADLGALAGFEATRAGKAGPLEVVFSRTAEDGYMSRRIKARAYVIGDPAAPSGLALLDTTCTHLGCGVSWSGERKAFLCPCHGGVYAADGSVVSGPPPRPLARLPLVVEGGRLSLDLTRLV